MFKIAIFLCMIFLSTSFFLMAEDLSPIVPYDLRCEYLKEPLGIDVLNPCLTWKLKNDSNEKGFFQSAYHILISTTLEKLNQNEGDLWDTGKVQQNTLQVIYHGKPLTPGLKVWWKVCVWDHKDRISAYSEPSSWEMGLISDENWAGNWIEPPEELYPRNMTDKEIFNFNPALLFRKTFNVEKNVKKARLYLTGLGYYECFINGNRVGDHQLDPGWTNYSKKIFYAVYDVSNLISSGNNVIGVHVGSGWYNPLPLRMWKRFNLREALTIGIPKVKAMLVIDTKDGKQITINTDENWKVALSPVVKNNVYLGEEYDGRKNPKGWNNDTKFDDSNWKNVVIAKDINLGKLVAQPIPPIKVGERYTPVNSKKISENKYLIDFGQNLAGRIYMMVNGSSGQKIQVRYGELLYPDGNLNPMTAVWGQIKNHQIPEILEKPFTAEQKDTFILNGETNELLTTHFTYHGFRYAEIEGIEDLTSVKEIYAERLHTAVDPNGIFDSSEGILNLIQKMCVETLLSNLHSVQTDCPHREKFGYGGDIVSASEFAMFNFDMSAFYRKVVRDFADEIRPNGGFTETAPFVGIADGGFGGGSGPIAWGSVHPFLLWQLYQYYGDRAIIEEQYPYSKKWLELLVKSAEDGIIKQCIGDHESVVEKQVEVSATAYYYLNAIIMQKLARILGLQTDVEYYQKIAEEIKKKFNDKFFNSTDGKIGIGSQANQSLYHAFNMGTPEQLNQAGNWLINDVVSRNNKLTTGIFGTKYLLGTLCELDRPDLAYEIVMQKECPGWRFMLENGATTLWEHWEFSDNTFSHNHPMFGSVSEWFYKYLGGISPSDNACGFDKVIIKPMFTLPIQKVNCSYESIRGTIISQWEKKNNEISWFLQLPPNCEGTVVLPNLFKKITIDNQDLNSIPCISDYAKEGNKIKFKIQNGKYQIKLFY